MLCSRSASFTRSTRISSATASKKFSKVLRLVRLARHHLQPLKLGHAFHQLADRRAEKQVDLGAGRAGVFDRVVEKRRRDGGIVEPEVGQDRGDFERMGKIGIAGGALLRAMLLHGVDVGAVKQILVDLGVVRRHPFDELVLAHHRRPSRGPGEENLPDQQYRCCEVLHQMNAGDGRHSLEITRPDCAAGRGGA